MQRIKRVEMKEHSPALPSVPAQSFVDSHESARHGAVILQSVFALPVGTDGCLAFAAGIGWVGWWIGDAFCDGLGGRPTQHAV